MTTDSSRMLRATRRAYSAFSRAELARAPGEVDVRYGRPWPYLFLQRPARMYEADGPDVFSMRPFWLLHHVRPELVYAFDKHTTTARDVTNAVAYLYHDSSWIRERFAYMFPSDARIETSGFLPALWNQDNPNLTHDDLNFLVLTGVDDLLERALPRLPVFERACLLLQALAYAEALETGGVGVRHWEFGVRFLSGRAPRLKLVRLDGVEALSPVDDDRAPTIRALRAILSYPWRFHTDREGIAGALYWALEHPYAEGLLQTVRREILNAFPRAGEMLEHDA